VILLAGVDEAGRGCLAGPVVAGAVILAPGQDLPGLDDSKKLSPRHRQELEGLIKAGALAWGLGVAWAAEIDRINILQATLRAMARAVICLSRKPDLLVVDGNTIIPSHLLPTPVPMQDAVVRGDSLVPAVSAASILAKVFRDRLMESLDRRYPGYGLAEHKGYGTPVHQKALADLGPSPQHRKTFKGVLAERGELKMEQSCLPGI
jgi:ribonuclease HII